MLCSHLCGMFPYQVKEWSSSLSYQFAALKIITDTWNVGYNQYCFLIKFNIRIKSVEI
jgi:hypothetical protein